MKGVAWINVFTGSWLMFTAWSVPGGIDTGRLTRNDATMGLALVALAGWSLVSHAARPLALWLQIVAGAWLVAAPFVLRYNPWSDVPTGLLAIAVAALSVPLASVEPYA